MVAFLNWALFVLVCLPLSFVFAALSPPFFVAEALCLSRGWDCSPVSWLVDVVMMPVLDLIDPFDVHPGA